MHILTLKSRTAFRRCLQYTEQPREQSMQVPHMLQTPLESSQQLQSPLQHSQLSQQLPHHPQSVLLTPPNQQPALQSTCSQQPAQQFQQQHVPQDQQHLYQPSTSQIQHTQYQQTNRDSDNIYQQEDYGWTGSMCDFIANPVNQDWTSPVTVKENFSVC